MPPTPVTPSTPHQPGSRRRLLLTLAAISIGWKIVVLTLGAAIPGWIIDDGVSALPNELRPYALDAKRSAATLWNGPIERYGVVRTLRVVSVQRLPDAGAGARRCGGLGARVRAYTYFGLPYSEARMVCDSGTVEYRVFRGRGAGSHAPTPMVAPAVVPSDEPVAPPAGARGSD